MSLRSLVGVFFICAAIVSPWLVRDWIPGDSAEDQPAFRVFVPGVENEAREKRQFSAVQSRSDRAPLSGPSSKSKRSPSEGMVKAFSTSARALLRSTGGTEVPQSTLSIKAAARHTDRIENEMRRLGIRLGSPVYCRIFKEESELELWLQPEGKKEFSLFRVYRICKWSGDAGPKTREGDRQTPEGFYFVTPGRMVPESKYHMGFDLGYPNLLDRFHGRSGSDARVQGKCVSNSSYALTDGAVEEVYTIAAAAFKGGQSFFRVHCFPFRMDDKRMDPMIGEYPANDEFWANLKEGYDFFEILRYPPNVTMSEDGLYQFTAK